MKTTLLFISILLVSCSGGGSGSSGPLSLNAPIYDEFRSIKTAAQSSSHSLTKNELDLLLSKNLISSTEYNELLLLAHN